GQDPQGAAHGCAAFSAGAGCPLGKSRRLREPVAQRRARRRGVFLCARFLCTSKERWLARSARETLLMLTLRVRIPDCTSLHPGYGVRATNWVSRHGNKAGATASALKRGSLLSWQK